MWDETSKPYNDKCPNGARPLGLFFPIQDSRLERVGVRGRGGPFRCDWGFESQKGKRFYVEKIQGGPG